MAAALHRHAQPLRITLAAAQRLVDAAPEEPLSPAWAQAVVALVLARWSETQLACVLADAGDLAFDDETGVTAEAGFVELPRLVGVDARTNLGMAMTRVASDAADVTELLGRSSHLPHELDVAPADVIAFDVALDCWHLERGFARAIRHCTLRWDACLWSEVVDISQVSSRCAVWRDGTVQEGLSAAWLERHGSSPRGRRVAELG